MFVWFVFVLANVILVIGNQSPDSKQKTQPLLLPDTTGIDGQLTANLHVDHFFSLWLVFHNDEVKVSDEPFTIFAPINAAAKDNSYLRNPETVKQLLLNHVLLGSKIDIRNVTDERNVTTLSGRTVRITSRNGKLHANDVLILEPKIDVPNGVLIIIDHYVVDNEELASSTPNPPENIPINLLPTDNETDRMLVAPSPPKKPEFIENVNQVLSFLKNGVRVFQHFLMKSNVTKLLNNGQEYTVLVPTDYAFQRWHPIDWGFYPFSVPEFTEDIIRNHFIIGNMRQSDIKEGQEVKTLGGRVLKFGVKQTLTVNGVNIVKGDTPVNGGNIMFINEVLFVSESVVSRLHQQHRDKETPPLLAFPWFGAQFLSHAFLALEHDRRFSHITRFLNLADLAPHVSGTGYTFFVPTDNAFEHSGLNQMPDNYLSNGNGLKLLLNHFVKQRLYERDLVDNSNFLTLANETIHVTRSDNGTILLNGVQIVESEVFVYNLGTMYFIDKLLFSIPESDTSTPSGSTSTTSAPNIPSSPSSSIYSEKVPEEMIEEVGTMPDILMGSTTEEETTVYEGPIVTNKINASNPIK